LISAGAGDKAVILAKRCSVTPLKCLCFCFVTESEKMKILRVAVKTLREEVAEKSRQLYQIQARREKTKNDLALAVPDWNDDSEIALEACIRAPKLMNMPNQNKKTERDVLTKNTWIADSGASTHMGNSDEGMTDVKVINSPV
jgi:hypothetical protein